MKIDDYIKTHDIKLKVPHKDREHQMQCACFKWFNLKYPKFRGLLFAVPNGGKRSERLGERYKAEGMVAGVSDLLLLKCNKFYNGLCIEMKTPEGKQSKVQIEWEQKINELGEFKYIVCRSTDEFIEKVSDYLNDF